METIKKCPICESVLFSTYITKNELQKYFVCESRKHAFLDVFGDIGAVIPVKESVMKELKND